MSAIELQRILSRLDTLERDLSDLTRMHEELKQRHQALEESTAERIRDVKYGMHDSIVAIARSSMDAVKATVQKDMRSIANEVVCTKLVQAKAGSAIFGSS